MRYDDVVDVVSKVAAYDPQFPKVSTAIVDAWVEHFEQFPNLSLEDGMTAVRVYYSTPDRKVPKPADISRIARDQLNNRAETEDEKALRAKRNDERLGLDTSWYKSPEELAAIEGAPERATAIRQFVDGMAAKASVQKGDETTPPAQPPRKRQKVTPRGSQTPRRRH